MKTTIRRYTADGLEPSRLFPSLHPVLARVYANRGLRDEQRIDYSLGGIPPPAALRDAKEAADILADALEAGASIMVVGDYDVDGACATVLMKRVLEECGAAAVAFLVPNRFTMGYGLSTTLVEAVASSQPDVLITVDNGISSYDAVESARQHGMTVIVTDHHLPPPALPRADAVVNPNRSDDDFPHKTLAGVGVAFYVLMMLRARLRERGWFETRGAKPPNLARYLDLVALGTVADLVPLDDLNRTLVHQGLARINHNHCRPGIKALLEVAKRHAGGVNERDLAFKIAPRLNAAGRLDDMSLGVRCLLSNDLDEARDLAAELDELNRQRYAIQHTMEEQGIAMVEAAHDGSSSPPGLCLYHDSWHQGVAGLLASRLSERYACPSIVFSLQEVGVLKGSARTAGSVHIRDLLQGIDEQHPGLLLAFGGHFGAAGLSIRHEQLDTFRDAFLSALQHGAAAATAGRVIDSDGALDGNDIGLELAETLERAGPWGRASRRHCLTTNLKCAARRKSSPVTCACNWGCPAATPRCGVA